MHDQILVTILSGVGFLIGTLAAYPHLRHRASWASPVLLVAVVLAIGFNVGYMLRTIGRHGAVETFEQNFDAVLLLSTLIGLVGLGAHLSHVLRGLDGLLFLAAAIVEFSELIVIRQPSGSVTGRPWFISHSLAFALSSAFFVAGGVAGIAYLLVNRMLRRKRLGLVRSVPPLEALERFGRWMPILGFPLFTFGILTGLCGVFHRKDIAAKAWYLDPTFLASIVAWVLYAYMCLSLMYRPEMRGRRAALMSTYGLGLVGVAFVTREFLSLMHR